MMNSRDDHHNQGRGGHRRHGHLTDMATEASLDALRGAVDELSAYVPGERGGSDAWGRLLTILDMINRLQSQAVSLAGYVHDEGVVEQREGFPCEIALGLLAGMTISDRKTLLTAADVLRSMPHTKALFEAGSLSWSQVRSIVAGARGLTLAERRKVDQAVADGHARGVTERNVDAQALCNEIDYLLCLLRPQDHAKKHKEAVEGSYLSIQLAFDGSSRWNGNYDPESTAVMLEAMDTRAARAAKQDHDHDHDEDHGEGMDAWPVWKKRGKERAKALTDICASYLAGGSDGPARPSMTVVAQAETLDGGSEPGQLLWRLPGGPVQLPADVVRKLACQADIRFVLKDGTRIVGIASRQAKTPGEIRAMVIARDLHCRTPGCANPIEIVHHVEYPDGPTALPKLVGLCRADHLRAHSDEWTLTMTPDGVCTWKRGRRTFVTYPADQQRLDPPDRSDGHDPPDRPPRDPPGDPPDRPPRHPRGQARRAPPNGPSPDPTDDHNRRPKRKARLALKGSTPDPDMPF
jgi:hypothetical protein